MARQEIPLGDQISIYADVSARFARNQASQKELNEAAAAHNPGYAKAIADLVWFDSIESKTI